MMKNTSAEFGMLDNAIPRKSILLLMAFIALFFIEWNSVATAENGPLGKNGPQVTNEDWYRPEGDVETLQRVLKDQLVSDRWFYQDLNAARQQARKTGKPVLAVFRCVPCGSAPALDGAVCTAGGAEASQFEALIREAGSDLQGLLDQFVAVRVVKMNGVNRNVFLFDRDVPYVAVFLNSDGVVYGRYGTRVSNDRKELYRHKLKSFQQSLRRALELHRDYPKNTEQLAANRGTKRSPSLAEEMATFMPFPAKANPPGVKNCIHCHTVGEAELRERLAEGPLALRDVWPYPLPNNIGLKIEVDDGLKVESVLSDTPAQKSGIQRGDVLMRLAGRPLTSEADIQWALHHAPDQGAVPVALRRGERMVELGIMLQGDWRKSHAHWRTTLDVLRPNVILAPRPGGPIAHYPQGKAATAGLREGDQVVAVDGRTDMRLEAEFLKYIHIDRPKATSVELTILRKGATSKVTLPLR